MSEDPITDRFSTAGFADPAAGPKSGGAPADGTVTAGRLFAAEVSARLLAAVSQAGGRDGMAAHGVAAHVWDSLKRGSAPALFTFAQLCDAYALDAHKLLGIDAPSSVDAPGAADAPLYRELRLILDEAFRQVSAGKGLDRHAEHGVAWQDQPAQREALDIGLAFPIGQARKKAREGMRLAGAALYLEAIEEMLGVIGYAATAVHALQVLYQRGVDDDLPL